MRARSPAPRPRTSSPSSRSTADPVALAKARAPTADAGALASIIDDVIAKNADKAAAYRAGKVGLLGFFVGQVVKAAAGAADPASAKALIAARLAAR